MAAPFTRPLVNQAYPEPTAGGLGSRVSKLRPATPGSPVTSPMPTSSQAVQAFGHTTGINQGPANPALKVPTGKPADANPWQVGGVSPIQAAPSAAAPTAPPPPVSSAPPGSTTSTFGPGNDLLSTQINPNTGGPNRTELAQNLIKDWDAQHAPQFAADQRAIGQNAAKFGRIGAGMTTNDLTGLAATYARDRQGFQNQLASGLADATIGDQRANNAELRTERDYQTNRSDKALQDAINQHILEGQDQGQAFQQALEQAQFGYGGSPVDTLGQFSGILGNQAGQAIGAGTDLLRSKPQPIDWSSLLAGNTGQVPQVTRNGVPITLSDLIKTGSA